MVPNNMLIPEQRDYIRDLARRVADFAASPENESIKKRWRDVNALRKPDRAPVCCNPVGAWAEIMPEQSLRCDDPALRNLEREFRRVVFKRDIGDDTPLEPYYPVQAAFEVDPTNTWGVDIARHDSDTPGGAWGYDPPIKSVDDLDKLRLPTFTYNREKTDRAAAFLDELLGDILPIKRACRHPLDATLCNPAADLRGLTEIMMDMAVEPELVHRLMAYLRDAMLAALDQVEATGLLTPNNNGIMFCADPIGPEHAAGKTMVDNLWIGANSQEFDQVSPAMWEEFLLEYQKPILARAGLSAYGCCENLTHKTAGVLSIPNLRIFVCSAWTDLGKVIEAVGDRYTIMWRQKASEVVFPDDVSGIRAHLDDGMRRLRGCRYQVVLRELQTLAGHPDRLHVWAKLAIEASEKWA